MLELLLNEIALLPREGADTVLSVKGPLYFVESTNTSEARVLSTSTENENVHIIRKLADESFTETAIPVGEMLLIPSPSANEEILDAIFNIRLL